MDSNRDRSYDEFISQDEDRSNSRRRNNYCQCLSKRTLVFWIFWIIIAVFFFFAGKMFERYNISSKTNKGFVQPVKEFLTGSQGKNEIDNTNNVYRLAYDSPGIRCKGVIKIYREEKNCVQESFSKFLDWGNPDEPYYRCGEDCYNLEDLLNIVRHGLPSKSKCIGSQRRRIFNCCLLSFLGNLKNRCKQENVSYACYNDDVHINRKLSRHEPMCDRPYYEINYVCKCFQSQIPVCGQEEMVECDHFDTGPNSLKCHMNTTRAGHLNNCICERPDTDTEVDSLESCEAPSVSKALSNGSAFLKCVHPLLIAILLMILYTAEYD